MTRYICECENLELPRAEYCTACDEYKNLEAERDAAVKDAERYRWLKKENSRTCPSTASACVTFNIGHDWIVESDLDAAIDAARGEA